MNQKKKQIVCENGMRFVGTGFGADVERVAELVFDTAMVGYQEVLSDQTYYGKMVCMSYPLIGTYGLNDDDYEGKTPCLSALIVREYNDHPSNYRYTETLGEKMAENDIPGIQGLDTRMLVRMLREEGSMRAILTDADVPVEEALQRIKAAPICENPVAAVSSKKIWYSRTANPLYNIVAVDCGIKHSFIRALNNRRCNVTVVPYDTSLETIMALRPDGVLFSNGPGDPAQVPQVIELCKTLQGSLPVFGIGLGHLVLAMANGAQVYKMKAGHRGANHPVRCLETGKIQIVSQNHSFAVCEESLAGKLLEVTHKNLLDGTVEGLRCTQAWAFSTQYHPDGGLQQHGESPFDNFVKLVAQHKEKGGAARA